MNTPNLTDFLKSANHAFSGLLAATLMVTSAFAADPVTTTNAIANAETNTSMVVSAIDQAQDKAVVAAPSDTSVRHVFTMLIPIVGIIGGVSIPILAIWGEYRKRRDLIEAYHKERLLALEKGMEPPAYPSNILEDDNSSSTPPVPGKHLKSGLLWLAIGVGAAIFLYFQPKAIAHFSVGSIPIAIGISQLIYHFVEKDRTKS